MDQLRFGVSLSISISTFFSIKKTAGSRNAKCQMSKVERRMVGSRRSVWIKRSAD
jgi:hypothetical protein